MAKIKICGLRTEADIDYVNEFKPDFIGFVFAKSKRQVTAEQAKVLRSKLSGDIIPVGVFVNEPVSNVAELINEGIIDIAQLHGDEDEAYVAELKGKLTKGQIIKAVRVKSREDIEKSRNIAADYILFDTYRADAYGGTGATFNWQLLKGYDRPFFLAGGINAENVSEAIKLTTPFAVDVSSAVETDGYKDREKIKGFIDSVRLCR